MIKKFGQITKKMTAYYLFLVLKLFSNKLLVAVKAISLDRVSYLFEKSKIIMHIVSEIKFSKGLSMSIAIF